MITVADPYLPSISVVDYHSFGLKGNDCLSVVVAFAEVDSTNSEINRTILRPWTIATAIAAITVISSISFNHIDFVFVIADFSMI